MALERGVRGRTTAHRILYRLSVVQPVAGVGRYATTVGSDSCRSWNVVRSCLAATLRDDPVHRAVDDVSDEESDDGSSVNDADEDPDIYTTGPQWTITTSGMRPVSKSSTTNYKVEYKWEDCI
ncbi:hypothetical protein J6590_077466 [Homalodisca vitripennis]|nr:hypothetical protein J6590_077466 [Homalodisca vitripennis]